MAARHDYHPAERPSPWRENHGNFLLIFAGVVLLVGLAILAYRQSRPDAPHYRRVRAEPPIPEDLVGEEGQEMAAAPGGRDEGSEAAAEGTGANPGEVSGDSPALRQAVPDTAGDPDAVDTPAPGAVP